MYLYAKELPLQNIYNSSIKLCDQFTVKLACICVNRLKKTKAIYCLYLNKTNSSNENKVQYENINAK